MSLTSHLDDRASPVRRYFDLRLPRTWDVLAALPRESRARAETPVVLPSGVTARYPWGTVGMAVDYRLRMMLGSMDPDEWLAARGADNMRRAYRVQTLPAYDGLLERIAALSQFNGQLALFAAGEATRERDLLACCVVLASYEQLYRAMPGPTWPLIVAGPSATLDEVLALFEPDVFDDLEALSRICADAAAEIRRRGALAFNPEFSGSWAVGGADADLIAGRQLIEIKTSKHPIASLASTLRQMIGYVLLDSEDAYHLDEVALLLPRQALTIAWPMEELLNTLAGHAVDLPALRAEFREVLDALAADRRDGEARWAAMRDGSQVIWECDFYPPTKRTGRWHTPAPGKKGDVVAHPRCGSAATLDVAAAPKRPRVGTAIGDLDPRLCVRCVGAMYLR